MVSTQDSESCDPGSNPGRTSSFTSPDTLAEWLRRVIRNHMGFPRAGSNPAGVAFLSRPPIVRCACGVGVIMYGSQPCDPGSNPGWRTIFPVTRASMAEWSKALDLSSSIRKNAWVRTPLEACCFCFCAVCFRVISFIYFWSAAVSKFSRLHFYFTNVFIFYKCSSDSGFRLPGFSRRAAAHRGAASPIAVSSWPNG